ncbi:MAG: hypothetical protein IPP35_09465 [Elusimicrobia bacterium]|nr:hypothetical protein [Elusimicrobiota bacterium]
MDYYYFGSMMFSAVSAVVLASFLRVKEAPLLTLAWRLSMVCTFAWSFGRAMMSVSTTAGSALGWMLFSYVGSIWVSALWLWVSCELTGQKINRFFSWVVVGSSALFSVVNFTPSFIGRVVPKLGFRFYDDSPGILFECWSFLFTVSLLWALTVVFRGIRRASGHQRNRLIAFFIFGLMGFLGSATTFPLVKNIGLYPFGVLAVAASTVLMSYAVLRYNVMDANLAFRYGTIGMAYAFLGLSISLGPFFGVRGETASVLADFRFDCHRGKPLPVSKITARADIVGGSPSLVSRAVPGPAGGHRRIGIPPGRGNHGPVSLGHRREG